MSTPQTESTTQSSDQRFVSCPMCRRRGKTWSGDDPRCGFLSGEFSPINWNCATLNALRDMVPTDQWNSHDDQHAILLRGVDSFHVLVTWYKRRGRTEGAWMVTAEGSIEPLTLTEAQMILAANAKLRDAGESGVEQH